MSHFPDYFCRCVDAGYGEIHAVNVREMIFIMVYVSFDMILGAYLLGNMTALIVKGSKTEKFRDKMTDLIKYMNRHNLGNSIGNEIKHRLRLLYHHHCNESAVLQDIPASIRTKVFTSLINSFLYSWSEVCFIIKGRVIFFADCTEVI